MKYNKSKQLQNIFLIRLLANNSNGLNTAAGKYGPE